MKRRSKKRALNSLLDFQQFEKKELLAGNVVADFGLDFPLNGPSTNGWTYQWNAPTDGPEGNTIDSPNLQLTPLIQNQDPAHSVNGQPSGTTSGIPGGFLHFKKLNLGESQLVSGHPGHPGYSWGGKDRYSVATYTVEATGYYSLGDSQLNLVNSLSSDGVEYRVFINREQPLESGTVNSGAAGYFDTELGFLVIGDTVNVAFGAIESQVHDSFVTDFSIYHHEDRATLVGDYQSDFFTTSPANSRSAQWGYFWNAPDHWVANGNSGVGPSSAIGDPANYAPLKSQSNAKYWSPDGDDLWNHQPDNHLKLTGWGGHPGLGYQEASNFEDRYAIAAFTVGRSGHYGLRDAWIEHAHAQSDGIEVYVHVDEGQQIDGTNVISANGKKTYFDADLGFINQGSTIYVAYGARNNHRYDAFSTDFQIVRLIPRAVPDLSLQSIEFAPNQTIEVGNQPGANDWERINNAFAEAETRSAPATIVFEPGKTYTLATNRSHPGGYFFEANLDDVLIEGNYATLLIGTDDPFAYSRGLFENYGGSNVTYQNLTIDYAKEVSVINASTGQTDTKFQSVTFTQGTIRSVTSNQIVLEIDDPDGEFYLPTNQFNSTIEFSAGYPVDANRPGRLKEGTEWAYYVVNNDNTKGITRVANPATGIGPNTFLKIDLWSTKYLATGDKFVLERRSLFGGSVFSITPDVVFRNDSEPTNEMPSNYTLNNITVYSSPTVFLASSLAENVNILNSNVEIRPNSSRLKSINGDGIHAQSNRTGTWVENSKFEGLGDDIMNFYTNPSTIHRISSDGTQFDLGHFNFLQLFGTSLNNFQVGEQLSFINPLTGKPIKDVKISNVDHGDDVQSEGQTINTIRVTVDQAVPLGLLDMDGDPPKLNTTVYNKSLAQGFYVADSVLTNSRRYGNFVMASNVHLVDNLYDGVSDQAIAGHTEHAWPLGLFANDILVQGNEFVNTSFSHPYVNENHQTGVVGFYMDKAVDLLVDEPVHAYSDIVIRDNVFYHWNKTAISIRNAQRVTIADNFIVAGVDNPVRDVAFEIQYSKDVTLQDNSVVDYGFGTLDTAGNTNVVEFGTTELPAPVRAWVEFDEGIVVDRTDSHRVTYNIDGTPTDGRFDDGIHFAGGQQVFLNDGTISGNIDNRTVSVWFKQDNNASKGKQVIYEEGSANRGLNIYLDHGRLYVGRWDYRGSSFINVPYDSREIWTHVALILDGEKIQLRGYFDGREFGATVAQNILAHLGWMSIGKADSTKFHSGNSNANMPTGLMGSVDEFRIYDSALSKTQIAALAMRMKS